ncbi:hypothetical protein ACTQ1L_10755 [Agathobacter sp. LCP21S3_B2]|uniref:hypothetical protein n=1 Tax=Agathobacter sp. LCP21S3_B2 TaxID=3438734 RepID=UPI003F932FFD
MSMVFVFLYIILGYWATGKTIYANSILIGNVGDIFVKRCVIGAILGWILIPVALIKTFSER